ncbi:MAG: hypothetical protein EOS20_04980 [Mesorhizobium sp.]|uniref:hypothetical protein n=1 Tax=Mesorhizobium sp. TaxID=1871066 RepID=UPI000FEA3BDE|nr:hypothetical protein [Mesorhizobium sp.]RWQ32827.1 MAG: hypothetical protein EOS21_30745 [Mesorhizobium sp.]RWQ39497.1 MAG: hypothetical protein EOS20_04980 [Mesorhizobium sp.]
MIPALMAMPYVGPILTFATSRVGLPLVIAGGVILIYEGVPIGPLRYIPYAGPALANLVDGRVDRQYSAGQFAERLVWQEQQRKALAQLAAKAEAKQKEIDAAAQAYVDQQNTDAVRIADLEQAIRDQKDEDLGPPDQKNGPVCRAGIPARVSTQLDAVGR